VFKVENFIMLAGAVTIVMMMAGCSVRSTVDTDGPYSCKVYKEGLYETEE
jgi:hypothetical protein